MEVVRDVGPPSQGLTEVLMRPYSPATISWTSLNAVGVPLLSFDPVRCLLSQPNIRDKLSGYQGLRANVRIRFQLTGNAFFAGKLVAFWVPLNRMGDYTGQRMSLTSVSGIPQRVEMYPIDSTTYELLISPLLPKRFWNRDNVQATWNDVWPPIAASTGPTTLTNGPFDNFVSAGLIVVTPFVPFQGPGDGDAATVKVWINFTDVHLDQAYGPIVSYKWLDPRLWNEVFPTKIKDVSKPIYYMTGVRYRFWGGAYPAPNADTMPEAEAVQKANKGTWSLRVKTAGEMIRAFIPFSGVYAPLVAAVGVVTGGVSRVLSYFNFDKPREAVIPQRILTAWKNMSYTNGIEEAQMTSADASNSVVPVGLWQPFDTGSTNIGAVCATQQVIYRTNLTTDLTTGTKLFNWAVAPWNAPVFALANVNNIISGQPWQTVQYLEGHTYPSWISRAFMYWRGECEIVVEVVAPAFAKAYLTLSWLPGDAEVSSASCNSIDGNATLTTDLVPEAKSKVIRVSGCTKERFVIPFRGADYALSSDTSRLGSIATDLRHQNSPSTNGSFWLSVTQPLTQYSPVGPAANPVGILVSVAFPNLQLFRPCGHQFSSYPGADYQRTGPPEDTEDLEDLLLPVSPSGDRRPGPSATKKKNRVVKWIDNIANREHPNTNGDTQEVDEATMGLAPSHFFGELVEDVLCLCKRPTVCSEGGGIPTVDSNSYIVSAFRSPVCFTNTYALDNYYPLIEPGVVDIIYPASFIAWFSRMYLTIRGEVTYTAFPSWQQGVSVFKSVPSIALNNIDFRSFSLTSNGYENYDPTINTSRVPSAGVAFASGAIYREVGAATIPATAVVPYYSRETFHLTPDFRGNDTAAGFGNPSYTLYHNSTSPSVGVTVYDENNDSGQLSANTTITAAAGDNFSFGGLYPPSTTTGLLSTHNSKPPQKIYQSYISWADH